MGVNSRIENIPSTLTEKVENKCIIYKKIAKCFLFASIVFAIMSFLWLWCIPLAIGALVMYFILLYLYYDIYTREVQKILAQKKAAVKSSKHFDHSKKSSSDFESDLQLVKTRTSKKENYYFPTVIENFYLYRVYNESISVTQECIKNLQSVDELSFYPEPENKYDEKALKIMHNDTFIGYVFRGMIQDMIHDFQKRQWPIRAYYKGTELIKDKLTHQYAIAFYKDLNRLESKVFTLKGISKIDSNTDEPRKNAFHLLTPSTLLEIDYDYEKEEYLTFYEGSYGEIYELGVFKDDLLCDTFLQFTIVEKVSCDLHYELIIRVYYKNK